MYVYVGVWIESMLFVILGDGEEFNSVSLNILATTMMIFIPHLELLQLGFFLFFLSYIILIFWIAVYELNFIAVYLILDFLFSNLV